MSYTTVYLAQHDGTFEEVAEYRNSHGFGPFVWSAVCGKYLGDEAAWLIGLNPTGENKLWPLWKDMRLKRSWRATLLVSYDMAVIERARFAEVAGYLREFVTDVGVRGRACHFLEIASLLDAHAHDEIVGMVFYGTSICEDPWHTYDEAKDEQVPYDLKKGEKHFFVGASLDESESPRPRSNGLGFDANGSPA